MSESQANPGPPGEPMTDGVDTPVEDAPSQNGGAKASDDTPPVEETSSEADKQSLSVIASKVEMSCQMQLATLQHNNWVLGQLINLMGYQELPPVRDTRIKLRVKLNSQDYKRMTEMGRRGVIERFQNHGGPWVYVTDMGLAGDNIMVLTVPNDDMETKVRDMANELSTILGIALDCRFKEKRYYVRVLHYNRHSGNDEPKQDLHLYSRWNNVDIVEAFWTLGILIFGLRKLKDAKKLWHDGVQVGDMVTTVVPYDLRASPKFCYKCWKPGHLKKECREALRCGRCAREHDTRDCDKTGSVGCVNCPGASPGHEAWSRRCQNKEVLRMRKECEEWERIGPEWAKVAHEPQLPDQAFMNSLRAYQNSPATQNIQNFMSGPGNQNLMCSPAPFGYQQNHSNPYTRPNEGIAHVTNVTQPRQHTDSSNQMNFMKLSQASQARLDKESEENNDSTTRPKRGRPTLLEAAKKRKRDK